MKNPSFLLDEVEKKTYGAMVLENVSNAEASYESGANFREHLRNYGFSEKNCKKYLKHSLQNLPYFHYAHLAEILPSEPLGWIFRLFVLEQSVPISVVDQLFSPQVVKWLLALGLFTVTEDRIMSRVLIFPVGGYFFVTDHRWQHDVTYADRVMYIGKDTLGLHYVTPYKKLKGGVLDLCCGSGIQGILAARYASFVVGVDINPRAVRFSVFNAILNNIRNIAFYEGSLFEPVYGQKFDLILANPPFVPKKETEILFRDGGRTGEDVLSEIIQDSPQYLSEGAFLCVATDLVNPKNYAKKLKKWLKNTSAKGLLIVEPYIKYDDYVVAHRLVLQEYRKQASSQQAWIRHLNQAGIDCIAPGFILLQKSSEVNGLSLQVCNIKTTLEVAFNQEVKNFFYPKKSASKYVALSRKVLATINLSNQAEIALEGHALFGPCTVSLPVYRWLLSIHKSKVRLSDLTGAQHDVVSALVRHGVLILT